MKTFLPIKQLAARFVDRAALVPLNGVQRDKAAVEYFVGAQAVAEFTAQNSLATRLTKVTLFLIMTRGFAGVQELAAADVIVED